MKRYGDAVLNLIIIFGVAVLADMVFGLGITDDFFTKRGDLNPVVLVVTATPETVVTATNTPLPTLTPLPTSTPLPTLTPTPLPTLASVFGTCGVDMSCPATVVPVCDVNMSCPDRSDFEILKDAALDRVGEIISDTIDVLK